MPALTLNFNEMEITQFKRENGIITPKDPSLRNPLRKRKSTKFIRKLMSERTLKLKEKSH